MKTFIVYFKIIAMVVQVIVAKNVSLLNHALQDVFDQTHAKTVQLFIQNFLTDESKLVDDIYKFMSKSLPTLRYAVNNTRFQEVPSIPEICTWTLITYIYASKTLDSSTASNIVDVVRRSMRSDGSPKFLMITVLEKRDNNFKHFLRFMWTKRVLDLTILELSEDPEIPITVHRYNPFNNTYTRDPYFVGWEWYPDKVTNLYRYPVKTDLIYRLGQNHLVRDSRGYPVKYRGPDGRALQTIKKTMNFTLSRLPRKDESIVVRRDNGTVSGSLSDLLVGRAEMLITTLPYSGLNQDIFGHTTPVNTERWCPLIPITYVTRNLRLRYLLGAIQSALIISIYWALSVLMKFERRIWRPTNIFGLMVSVTMGRQPSRIPERISFLAVLLVSAVYSSNMFANLTVMNIQSNEEVDYKTFAELERSGLIPVLEHIGNITLRYATGDLLKLRNKAISSKVIPDCENYLIKYRNITCFTETNRATAFIFENMRRGRATIKICNNLCYWEPPVGYVFHKFSPYIERVSNIMMRMVESGIRVRWYLDYIEEFVPKNLQNILPQDSNVTPPTASQLIIIALSGYLVSFLVFLAEIAVHRFKR